MLLRQTADGGLQVGSDLEGSGFAGGEVSEGDGLADAEGDSAGAGEPGALRPGGAGTVEVAGNDGDVGAGDEQAKAGFEFADFAGGRAGPFGENDEDVAG